jgi:hypothetical protein
MSDFSLTWELVRGRLLKEIEGLSQAQLNWRIHPQALTIGEMCIHVAGVEVSFSSQLTEEELSIDLKRLKSSATDGVVNDLPFPYAPIEITPEFVSEAMTSGEKRVRPLIENPTEEIRSRQIKSALGPMIDGTGAFARLAYHPSYHHAQVYLIKSSPAFPAA